jgi:hypothetical protein
MAVVNTWSHKFYITEYKALFFSKIMLKGKWTMVASRTKKGCSQDEVHNS